MIAFAAAIALGVAALAAFVRVALGPTLHDRAAAAHTCLQCLALWIAAFAVLDGRAAWIDVALAIVISDAVVGVAAFKALRMRSLQSALTHPRDQESVQ